MLFLFSFFISIVLLFPQSGIHLTPHHATVVIMPHNHPVLLVALSIMCLAVSRAEYSMYSKEVLCHQINRVRGFTNLEYIWVFG